MLKERHGINGGLKTNDTQNSIITSMDNACIHDSAIEKNSESGIHVSKSNSTSPIKKESQSIQDDKTSIKEVHKVDAGTIISPPNEPLSYAKIAKPNKKAQSNTKKSSNKSSNKTSKKKPSFSLSTSDNGTKAVVNKTGMILHKQQKNKNMLNMNNAISKQENAGIGMTKGHSNDTYSSSQCNAFSFGFDIQFK